MPHPPLTDSQKRFRKRYMIVWLGATALLAVAALAAGPLMPNRPLGTCTHRLKNRTLLQGAVCFPYLLTVSSGTAIELGSVSDKPVLPRLTNY
jgi:hypothetical protein